MPPEVKVSGEAKDFVQKLLVKDLSRRMTADEALKHPWLLQEPDEPAPPGLLLPTAMDAVASPIGEGGSQLLPYARTHSSTTCFQA